MDRERGPILSELAMRNTPEYRCEVDLYGQIYGSTSLPKRLPIGLEEQIKVWSAEELYSFYKKMPSSTEAIDSCLERSLSRK